MRCERRQRRREDLAASKTMMETHAARRLFLHRLRPGLHRFEPWRSMPYCISKNFMAVFQGNSAAAPRRSGMGGFQRPNFPALRLDKNYVRYYIVVYAEIGFRRGGDGGASAGWGEGHGWAKDRHRVEVEVFAEFFALYRSFFRELFLFCNHTKRRAAVSIGWMAVAIHCPRS